MLCEGEWGVVRRMEGRRDYVKWRTHTFTTWQVDHEALVDMAKTISRCKGGWRSGMTGAAEFTSLDMPKVVVTFQEDRR